MRYTVLTVALLASACGGSVDADALAAALASQNGNDEPDEQAPEPSAPEPEPEPVYTRVPMFVIQGHMQRTLISCDDGQSWVADASADDNAVCFSDGLDCDHSEFSGNGVIFAEGYFFASYGWGTPGGVFRSEDGVTWTEMLDNTSFSHLAYGNDTLLAGDHYPRRSTDLGTSWVQGESSGLATWTTRYITFVDIAGGLFVLTASNSIADVVFSSDNGVTWWHADTIDETCGNGLRGAMVIGDALVLVNGANLACVSTDGAKTFTTHEIPEGTNSKLLMVDGKLTLFGRNTRITSTDGVRWDKQTVAADFNFAQVDISDTGTLAAVSGSWAQWYDQQKFFRSTDKGLTWKALAPDKFKGGHPIRTMTFGYGKPSAACPTATRP